jgi:hypothetical protein
MQGDNRERMMKELSEGMPVMHSDKAIAYFKKYVQRGIDQFGYRYSMEVDELAEVFSRQPLDFQGFLKSVRAEDRMKRMTERSMRQGCKLPDTNEGYRCNNG